MIQVLPVNLHSEALQTQIRVCWRIKLILQCLLVCSVALHSAVAAPTQMKQVIEVDHSPLRYIAETSFTYLQSRKNGRPDATLFSIGGVAPIRPDRLQVAEGCG